MIRNEELVSFFIIVLKCFFILIFFGLFLPRFLDYLLYNFISKPNVYDNSIFVHSLVRRNLDIIYNYIYVFEKFLGF